MVNNCFACKFIFVRFIKKSLVRQFRHGGLLISGNADKNLISRGAIQVFVESRRSFFKRNNAR